MVKLFLAYGADPNLSNDIKMTTMHIAARKKNVEMVKVLVEREFDIEKLINQIVMGDRFEYRSVFLMLCSNGSVECLDYLLSVCKRNVKNKNKWLMDVFAKDSKGRNGLYVAVGHQKLSMCEYLLKKIYDNDELRQEMMNQTDKRGQHISELAAEKTSADCVEIFKLLIKYKCDVDYQSNYMAPIYIAAICSPPMFSFMLNQGLFDAKHQCKKIITEIVVRGRSFEIKEKNIIAVCNYIQSHRRNLRYVHQVLESIIEQGFDDNLIYFIISLNVFLSTEKIDDWQYFYLSKYIVSKSSINKLKNIIGIDKKWIELLNNMLIARNDVKMWHEKFQIYDMYINNQKENDFFNETFYNCSNNHRMNHCDSMVKLCHDVYCGKCHHCVKFNGYKCDMCSEYLCADCNYSFKLNQMLKKKLFTQFNQEIAKYYKDSHVMRQVRYYVRLACISANVVL